ncbi:MAG: phosphatidylserine decarboxylase family protein [Bacteroidota bacterium]
MRLHKEGNIIIFTVLIGLALLNGAVWFVYPFFTVVHGFIFLLSLVFLFLIVRFFRIPKRKYILDDNTVLSSADGTVVAIERVDEKKYFNEPRIQVSIFMSVHNVHQNLFPITGRVAVADYIPGKYLIAHHPKSSEENEMEVTVVRRPDGKSVLVRQIAGIMARRVICYAKPGDDVKQCDELGFIKFGSRNDLLLPVDAVVKVKIGDKVKAGITAIATL